MVKSLKTKKILLGIAIGTLLLTACGKKELENAHDWPLEEFTYTNQDGKQLGLEDLKGKVWMADFIFTECDTVCPPMTANMAEIQRKAKDEGIKNLQFVSFSVDPDIDKPEVLKEYGERFEIDYKNWDFLTGYGQEEIEQYAMKNFKTIVKKPKADDQVIHGTSFYLVGKDGLIKKSYSGVNDVPYDQILEDIKILQ
ncbi:SCO family protein [Neobacillus piezotolerans]|uniref:SCO family protein n=1 Tax=Neobacillus piezotolerans TaxID=2259171 RepID=A0A3D8GPL6_9BACI|nr:SCO family protein [Neobacillus piezotolerans]RDU36435.1 SCO family protein [Neobacillus piezotolerans]